MPWSRSDGDAVKPRVPLVTGAVVDLPRPPHRLTLCIPCHSYVRVSDTESTPSAPTSLGSGGAGPRCRAGFGRAMHEGSMAGELTGQWSEGAGTQGTFGCQICRALSTCLQAGGFQPSSRQGTRALITKLQQDTRKYVIFLPI